MGQTYSKLALYNPNVPFFIISFYWDQLHVFNADDHIVNEIRNCLAYNWPKGIQKETRVSDAFIFKLKGQPFWPQSTDHAQFVLFSCVLLKQLSQSGYIKIMSSDINWYNSLSAWFFYKSPTTVANDIEFCAVDMWGWDKLKFFNTPPEINEALKYTVYENWRGIQRADLEHGLFTMKLKGFPWQSPSGEDGIRNRVLIMKMVQVMANYGWTLYSATNIDAQTDTLFFCRKPNMYISPTFTSSMFAVSLSRNDRLRIINANEQVVGIIRGTIMQYWSEIQHEENHFGSVEFKLKGYPWYSRGEQGLPSITLLCQIFTNLRRAGWKVIMNLDISRSPHDKGVFFFIQMPPKDTYYCALGVKDSSNLYALHMHEQITQHLTQIIMVFFDLQDQPMMTYNGNAIKWKLQGGPWASMGQSHAKFNGQLMMAGLLNAMIGFNYHLCSAADITSVFVKRDKGSDYKPDNDTLFFALDDPPLNVGLFTDQPKQMTMQGFFSQSAPAPPPAYDLIYSD